MTKSVQKLQYKAIFTDPSLESQGSTHKSWFRDKLKYKNEEKMKI